MAGMNGMDTEASAVDHPDPTIIDFVENSGLVQPGKYTRFERLPGGVSSDIWLVHADDRSFCVKRALAQLRVAADWRAPIERNTKEAAWIKAVAGFLPEAVPSLLAEDAAAGMFAMDYLSPQSFEVWKAQLQRGHVLPTTAAEVGRRLVRIHSKFARSPAAAAEFATDAIFHAIRLEPYLLATARAHPDRTAALEKLAETTAHTADPGSWRCQPKEHSGRTARPCLHRCRMRLVRGSSLRSCLLPQSPVAQMPVGALGSGSALGGLSKPDRDLP
jgi:hypothetical protein